MPDEKASSKPEKDSELERLKRQLEDLTAANAEYQAQKEELMSKLRPDSRARRDLGMQLLVKEWGGSDGEVPWYEYIRRFQSAAAGTGLRKTKSSSWGVS